MPTSHPWPHFTLPATGAREPTTVRRKVVFPWPLSPTIAALAMDDLDVDIRRHGDSRRRPRRGIADGQVAAADGRAVAGETAGQRMAAVGRRRRSPPSSSFSSCLLFDLAREAVDAPARVRLMKSSSCRFFDHRRIGPLQMQPLLLLVFQEGIDRARVGEVFRARIERAIAGRRGGRPGRGRRSSRLPCSRGESARGESGCEVEKVRGLIEQEERRLVEEEAVSLTRVCQPPESSRPGRSA